jgi:hypothetical protein
VDPGQQRGRGPDARVLVDQAAPPAVQRPAGRRQELPVPGADRVRRVAASDGGPRASPEGHPLLRPVRARLCDPGDPGRAAPDLPAAHVFGREVPAARTAGPTVPPVPHREVLGPVCRRDRRRLVRRSGRRVHLVPRGGHRAGRPGPARADGHGRGVTRLRGRGPAPGSARLGRTGGRAPADGGRARRGRRRRGHLRGPVGGLGAGLLRASGPGRRPTRVPARQGHGPDAGADRGCGARARLRRRAGSGVPPAGPGAGASRGRPALRGVPLRGPWSGTLRRPSPGTA